MHKNQLKHTKITSIKVDISEILTQRTCAHIVIEIIKFLVYQKLQIPYPYDVLKYLVQKKREIDKANSTTNESCQSANYFRVASTAVDVLDTLFKNITAELEGQEPPSEVVLLLGALPMCPREAYRLFLPPAPALMAHFHSGHKECSQKIVMKSLRQISFSQDLLGTVHHPLAPTNMFVFLKRASSRALPPTLIHTAPQSSDFFLPTDHYQISSNIPQAFIHLKYNPTHLSENCCRDMRIFNEFPPVHLNKPIDHSALENCGDSEDSSCEGSARWFQADVTFKGFKDCRVNGKSVSDLWLKS